MAFATSAATILLEQVMKAIDLNAKRNVILLFSPNLMLKQIMVKKLKFLLHNKNYIYEKIN